MLRVRYLLYIGLFIYLLDLHQIGSDALSLLPKKEKKSNDEESENNAKESSGVSKKQEAFIKSLHDKSRETSSGEHLKFAFNPGCGWLKIFGPAGLQNNCALDKIVGLYKLYKKYSLAASQLI